jgi:hypothetical protein
MNDRFKAICIKEIEFGRCAKLLHLYEFEPLKTRHAPDGTPFQAYPGLLECKKTNGFHYVKQEIFDEHFRVVND